MFGKTKESRPLSLSSVKELEQLGYKIVVCPVESLMVCARAMRDL
jgi:2-methylisocitrate lyase-like PEP mutase family enzyme